jgi:heme exporter protein CcmD
MSGMTRSSAPGWRPSLDVVAGAGSAHPLGWVSGTLEPWRDGEPDADVNADEEGKLSPRTVEDRLSVCAASGERHTFELEDSDLLVAAGDELTVLWALGKRGERGPTVSVRNHTTGGTYHDDDALLGLLAREPGGFVWSAFLICTCFTPLVILVPWSLLRRRRARRAIQEFKRSLDFLRE